MAQAADFQGDVNIRGTLSCTTLSVPAGTIENDDVAASAAISASKLQSCFNLQHSQTGTVAAVAGVYLRTCRGTGQIVAIEAALEETIPSGDRTVTIDLQLGNAGAAFATVLSAPIVLDSANVLRTSEVGAISSATTADNDRLRLVITIAGSTGTNPAGLNVTVTYREAP